MRKVSKYIATLFFIGFSPIAPGTLASLCALPFYYVLKGTSYVYFFLTLVFLVIGFWSSSVAEKEFKKKDPKEIVIDEFSSMLLVFLFVPKSIFLLIVGFLFFRLFDIFKIPAIKKLERLPKGYGIMLDDIAAAILTNVILQVLRFMPIPF